MYGSVLSRTSRYSPAAMTTKTVSNCGKCFQYVCLLADSETDRAHTFFTVCLSAWLHSICAALWTYIKGLLRYCVRFLIVYVYIYIFFFFFFHFFFLVLICSIDNKKIFMCYSLCFHFLFLFFLNQKMESTRTF